MNIRTLLDVNSATATVLSPIKGDLLVFNGTNWVKLDPGTDGQNLQAQSAQATGLQWVTSVSNNPWLIDVNPMVKWIDSIGTWGLGISTSQIMCGYILNSSNTVNDYIAFDVMLSAGTWTLSVIGVHNTNGGIITASLDGGNVGTIDQYAAALQYNAVDEIVGIAVAASGKKRLKMQVASKNASSTAYYAYMTAIQLRRTA